MSTTPLPDSGTNPVSTYAAWATSFTAAAFAANAISAGTNFTASSGGAVVGSGAVLAQPPSTSTGTWTVYSRTTSTTPSTTPSSLLDHFVGVVYEASCSSRTLRDARGASGVVGTTGASPVNLPSLVMFRDPWVGPNVKVRVGAPLPSVALAVGAFGHRHRLDGPAGHPLWLGFRCGVRVGVGVG